MNKLLFSLFLVCFLTVSLCATSPPDVKQLSTNRISSQLKIDGQLNEAEWQKSTIASGFIQNNPSPGSNASQQTEVRVLYDNAAIYIGAKMYDTQPDSILRELTERDRFGNTDWFGFLIDAYQDGINGVGFYVSPAGIQVDIKYSALEGGGGPNIIFSGDTNWDAVWESETTTTADGWVAEFKIPYSAIRFPNVEEQQWNINFARQIRRNREVCFWNEVKPEQNGFVNQSGKLTGISNIESPVRLSATPFIATYIENYRDQSSDPKNSRGYSLSGGMDIKYGINDAFTLDMTLIPDFGEAQSDNQVLNLSPFEVRFDENRQFFTEGTELFNKGDLFYSRRVGGRPLGYYDVFDMEEEGDEIIDNPSVSQLYNATKVSGRTTKGLGLGMFNATAAPTIASIKKADGSVQEIETNPLTNYNVLVFDQNLKNNSYITLINTNVLRNGATYDANVTGTEFSIRNKGNSYALNGGAALSQQYATDETTLGHSFQLFLLKTSGNLTWELGYRQKSDTYDQNDLGFLERNNQNAASAGLTYSIYKPFWKLINIRFGTNYFYERLYKPNTFAVFGFNFWTFGNTKKFTTFNLWTYIEPVNSYDYFEPRTDDFSRYYLFPTRASVGGFISTDYRKTFALDVSGGFYNFNEEGRYSTEISIRPRVRVNDKFSFSIGPEFNNNFNEVGYVDTDENDAIIFGIRDRVTVENRFEASYIFNNRMSLTFRLRHYWSKASYSDFKELGLDGRLYPTAYDEYNDNSFNAFNIDTVYRWRFAPGSDILLIWKNITNSYASELENVDYSYKNSLNRLNNIPQLNSLSFKIIYFLDYLSLKRKSFPQ